MPYRRPHRVDSLAPRVQNGSEPWQIAYLNTLQGRLALFCEALRTSRLPQVNGAYMDYYGNVCALTAAAMEVSRQRLTEKEMYVGFPRTHNPSAATAWTLNALEVFFGIHVSKIIVKPYYSDRSDPNYTTLIRLVQTESDIYERNFADVALAVARSPLMGVSSWPEKPE